MAFWCLWQRMLLLSLTRLELAAAVHVMLLLLGGLFRGDGLVQV